jgi:hypothetical protein
MAAVIAGVSVGGAAGSESKLGDKVLAFCKQHKGECVGDGECSSLAGHALRAAGAKTRGPDEPNKGDYTWGDQVYRLEQDGTQLRTEGSIKDVHPGDIIQFRDTKWAGAQRVGRYTKTFLHHTAVVAAVENSGKVLKIYQQNFRHQKIVTEDRLRLPDLREGWIRIYRPAPRVPAEATDRP